MYHGLVSKNATPGLRDNELAFSFAAGEGRISIEDLQLFSRDVAAIIRDVTRAAVGTDSEWLVTDLSLGSINLVVRPEMDVGTGAQARDAIIRGLNAVQTGSARPPYFSEAALKRTRKLIHRARKRSLCVSSSETKVHLTRDAEINIDQMLDIRRSYLGSVIGALDIVSVHGGIRATLFGALGEVVTCEMPSHLLDDAKNFLGRRVLAYGTIRANSAGNVVTLAAQQLFTLPKPGEVSPLVAYYGSIPDFTGDESVTDFLRQGWGA